MASATAIPLSPATSSTAADLENVSGKHGDEWTSHPAECDHCGYIMFPKQPTIALPRIFTSDATRAQLAQIISDCRYILHTFSQIGGWTEAYEKSLPKARKARQSKAKTTTRAPAKSTASNRTGDQVPVAVVDDRDEGQAAMSQLHADAINTVSLKIAHSCKTVQTFRWCKGDPEGLLTLTSVTPDEPSEHIEVTVGNGVVEVEQVDNVAGRPQEDSEAVPRRARDTDDIPGTQGIRGELRGFEKPGPIYQALRLVKKGKHRADTVRSSPDEACNESTHDEDAIARSKDKVRTVSLSAGFEVSLLKVSQRKVHRPRRMYLRSADPELASISHDPALGCMLAPPSSLILSCKNHRVPTWSSTFRLDRAIQRRLNLFSRPVKSRGTALSLVERMRQELRSRPTLFRRPLEDPKSQQRQTEMSERSTHQV